MQLQTIIHNLQESYNGKPWFGIPVQKKLKGISWQIVSQQSYGTKSIAVLVMHIINWRIFVLKKLEGDEAYNIIIDGENDWDIVDIKNQREWEELLDKLHKTQEQLIQILSSYSDELLVKKVPGKEYFFEPILTSIAQHDIYHLGQIAMLNEMSKG